jgi:hypothetical protein
MRGKEDAMTPADPNTIADPTTTIPLPTNTPTVDLLAEPTFEECIEHHSRYFDDRSANQLDFRGIPDGHYIAYFNGRIYDHDVDPVVLLKRVAARLNVHPARVFVHYPWMW